MGVASAPLVCVLYDYKCYGTMKSSVSRAMQWKRVDRQVERERGREGKRESER